MKIVSTGRTISTTEYLAKKVRARRKRMLIACGAVLVLIIIAVLVLRLKSFQIKEVVAEGVPSTGSAQVQEVASELLSGSYLWLVPKTNIFFYPRSHLEQELGQRFPRLSSIAASLEGAHILHIKGVERAPFARYCALALSGVEGCYFLDETGFIFDASPVFSEGVYFTYATAVPLEDPLGRQFIPQPEFESLAAFVTRVGTFGVEPHSLELSDTEGTMILRSGASIKFSRGVDTAALSRALESFLESEPIKAEKDFWNKLSTLDMRTENKVFYSFK